MNRKFKGIWIEKDLWLTDKLTMQEKVFFAEIDSLDDPKDGCYASNQYLADFFQLSTVRVSQVINSLVAKGIITAIVDHTQNNKRTLRVHKENLTNLLKESLSTSQRNLYEPLKGKFKPYNKDDNKDYNKEREQEEKPKPALAKMSVDQAIEREEKSRKREAEYQDTFKLPKVVEIFQEFFPTHFLNAEQIKEFESRMPNLKEDLWRRTLADWRTVGYKPKNFLSIIDKYHNELAKQAPQQKELKKFLW
jgi:hypothetical protein